jgi:hypothetical protein
MTAPTLPSEPIDTTVITHEPVDYGAGATDRVVFGRCKYRVDDSGDLNVYLADDPDRMGNVATYARGEWRTAIRGVIVALGEGAGPVGKHELRAVRS